jgi:hypothetical protein
VPSGGETLFCQSNAMITCHSWRENSWRENTHAPATRV